MTSPAELAALLARASAAGLRPKQAEQVPADEALGLVLRALRGTILPRVLTIRTDRDAMLRGVVAGGHLLTVLDVQGVAAADLVQRPLRGGDPAEAAAVAQLLNGLFAVAGRVAIDAGPVATPPDPTQTGVPAEQLMTLLGLAPFAASVPDPVAYFREAAADVVLAELGPDTTWVPVQDGFVLPAPLARSIGDLMTADAGPCAEIGPGEFLFLAPTLAPSLAPGADEALAVAITLDNGAPRALIFDADSLPDLAAYWSGMLHGMVRLDT